MEIKWISESTPAMKKVICAVFPMLWDRNIKSSIYSVGHDQSIIKDFNMAVYGSIWQLHLFSHKQGFDL